METFGKGLRAERQNQGISLRELARRVEISPTYLSHIEIDHVPPPSPEVVCRLANALGIDAEVLLARAGRWDERATQALSSRSELRDLFSLAFSMDPRDVERLVEELEERRSSLGRQGGLFGKA